MKLCGILLVCLLSFQSQAAEKVEFVANKIHSLLVFVKTISGDPHGSEDIKELFEKSRFNTEESKKKIEKYQDLDKAFGRYIPFSGAPEERKSGFDVAKIIMIQSAFAEDIKDLQERSLGILGNDELSDLIDVMKYFEPIHDKLLWIPYKNDLEKVVLLYERKSRDWNLNEMFIQAVQFYKSKWPESQKFRISLFPIPPNAKASSASSYGSFESVGIIIGEKDITGRFGVIFHELCHSLYSAQSSEFQNQLSKWYGSNPSPYASITYSWINETLATALGNGWAYYKIAGKLDTSSWYNHEIIENFSKALYPEVLKYLEDKKPIDEKFVGTSIQIFQKIFPDSIKDFRSLFSRMVFITNGSFGSTRNVINNFRSLFRMQSMSSSSPLNNEETLRQIKEDSSATTFILSHRSKLKNFEYLKTDYAFLVEMVNKAQKNKNLIGLFDQQGKKFVVAILNEELGYEYLIQKLKVLKKIDKLNEFQDLDRI